MARTRLAKLSLTDIDSRVRYHYRTNLRFRLGMDLETRKKIHIQTIEALCRPQNYVSRLLLNLSKEGSSAGRTAVMGGALNRIMKRKRINRQKAAEILMNDLEKINKRAERFSLEISNQKRKTNQETRFLTLHITKATIGSLFLEISMAEKCLNDVGFVPSNNPHRK